MYSHARNLGIVAQQTIKSSPGNLHRLYITNRSGAAVYLLLFDHPEAVTASASNFIERFTIPANSTLLLDEGYFASEGTEFRQGITWALSTVHTGFTAITASNCDVFARYR